LGDVADGWIHYSIIIETTDAGLLVLSVRQGNRTSSRTRGWGPIDRFVQGRIWGFEDSLLRPYEYLRE
jgi:hypothetical protein